VSGRGAWLVLIRLSDSFRATVAQVAAEAGAELLEWLPAEGEVPSAGAAATILLAGGEEGAALDLVPRLAAAGPRVFLVGAAPDHRLALGAIQAGAGDYFALPDDLDLLRRSIEREIRDGRSRDAAERFAEAERRDVGFGTILGRSPAMRRTIEQAERVAPHGDVTILIGGETGTGKELLARAIHYHSPRASAPFVEINCAAIPANLLESELFGHERGAFTGAIAAKPGLFELANGGTLFLDEIGNLPLELQPKLLRALESRSIRRVGGQATRQIDVRVVAATHVDLAEASRVGKFRQDLYYRLNVVALTLPPLRAREHDVELLAETFVTRIATTYGLPVPPLTPEVRAALRTRPWPGNVRELRNAIERALVLSPQGTLRAEELQPDPAAIAVLGGSGLPFPVDLATLTRAAAARMLELAAGNKSEAARRLGISRPRLLRLLVGDDDATS
jgi:two-component system response regulator HydG